MRIPAGMDTPESVARIGRALCSRGLTLAVAESCTGGLLGHRITSVAGSSDYFLGGVIVYANAAKTRLLGVAEETLDGHGAVSAAVAREMAQGVRRVLGADLGAAVTGVAGPGGGTPAKPVGLVFTALAHERGCRVRECRFSGDRDAVRRLSAETVLGMLRDFLV